MCSFVLIWAGNLKQNVNKWCHQESIYWFSVQFVRLTSQEFKVETTILALFDKYCQKRQFFSYELLNQQKWKLPFLTIFAVFGNKHWIFIRFEVVNPKKTWWKGGENVPCLVWKMAGLMVLNEANGAFEKTLWQIEKYHEVNNKIRCLLSKNDKYCQKRQFFSDKLLILHNFVDLIRKKMSKALLKHKININGVTRVALFASE